MKHRSKNAMPATLRSLISTPWPPAGRRSSASVCARRPHNGGRRRATSCLLLCPVARARQRLHPWSAASLPAPRASQRLSPSCYILLAVMPRSASATALAPRVGPLGRGRGDWLYARTPHTKFNNSTEPPDSIVFQLRLAGNQPQLSDNSLDQNARAFT
jgi:hypothetical protein